MNKILIIYQVKLKKEKIFTMQYKRISTNSLFKLLKIIQIITILEEFIVLNSKFKKIQLHCSMPYIKHENTYMCVFLTNASQNSIIACDYNEFS